MESIHLLTSNGVEKLVKVWLRGRCWMFRCWREKKFIANAAHKSDDFDSVGFSQDFFGYCAGCYASDSLASRGASATGGSLYPIFLELVVEVQC